MTKMKKKVVGFMLDSISEKQIAKLLTLRENKNRSSLIERLIEAEYYENFQESVEE
jgi:lipoprotein NlpI